MALEGNGNYVFDGFTHYNKVFTNSTLNYQTDSASWHSGIATSALNMSHQPSLQATAEGLFRSVNSSYSLDNLLPFSVQGLDNVNRRTNLEYVKLASDHSSQRNFLSSFLSSISVQQRGIERKCNACGEESSSSDQSTSERKRRILPNDKASTVASHEQNIENESKSKRPKREETKREKDDSISDAEQGIHIGKPEVNPKQSEQNGKPPEPPRDYIYVRVRRGQATDNHSLAERFLSMKLEAVNPRLDYNMEGFLSKDMLEPSRMEFSSHTPMTYPQFHQPEWAAMQVGVSCETEEQCMGNARQVVIRRKVNENPP